jgi:hypothetical protein
MSKDETKKETTKTNAKPSVPSLFDSHARRGDQELTEGRWFPWPAAPGEHGAEVLVASIHTDEYTHALQAIKRKCGDRVTGEMKPGKMTQELPAVFVDHVFLGMRGIGMGGTADKVEAAIWVSTGKKTAKKKRQTVTFAMNEDETLADTRANRIQVLQVTQGLIDDLNELADYQVIDEDEEDVDHPKN